MKKSLIAAAIVGSALFSSASFAEDYKIDIEGQHAFIQFKIKHLGYSWLYGRFNKFDGSFSYDENAPENASIQVTIDTSSIDTNHAAIHRNKGATGIPRIDRRIGLNEKIIIINI